jgi:hypothetical protein
MVGRLDAAPSGVEPAAQRGQRALQRGHAGGERRAGQEVYEVVLAQVHEGEPEDGCVGQPCRAGRWVQVAQGQGGGEGGGEVVAR